jgi:hypothetical protein
MKLKLKIVVSFETVYRIKSLYITLGFHSGVRILRVIFFRNSEHLTKYKG